MPAIARAKRRSIRRWRRDIPVWWNTYWPPVAIPIWKRTGKRYSTAPPKNRGNIPIIKLLQAEGFDISGTKNSAGETILFTAARHNNYPAVKFLLGAGGAPEHKNHAGQTVLNIAAQQRQQIQITEAAQTAQARENANYEVLAPELASYYAAQKENNRKIISLLRRTRRARPE